MKGYLFGLTLWGFGLLVLWWLNKENRQIWEIAYSVATWFLALGVAYAFRQVQQTRKSTNAQLAVQLSSELRDKVVLGTLRKIYELKPDDITRLLSSKEEKDRKQGEEIVHVLNKLELLGALVAQGIVDKRLAIETYGGAPVLKCWYQLGENYIKKVREQRGLFCKYLEDFARRTVKHQIKDAPKDEWICFLKRIPPTQAEDKINLIETLSSELLSPCEKSWVMFIRCFKSIVKPALR